MYELIWAIVVILFLAWLLGFVFFNAGFLIHILLLLVIIGILYNLLAPRRTVP